MKFTVTLPWPPRELGPNHKIHYRAKAPITKQARQDAYYLVHDQTAAHHWQRQFDNKILHDDWYFYPPDNRRRDRDNVKAACKAYQDGICEALGIDDRQLKAGWAEMMHKVEGGKVEVHISLRNADKEVKE